MLAVFAFALRGAVRASAPLLFALMAASALITYVAAVHGDLLSTLPAALSVAIAAAALLAVIFETEARLALGGETAASDATWLWLRTGRGRRWRRFEDAFRDHVANPPQVSESLFSFQRRGRTALLVFIRRDHRGQLLEATAYDPDDYA